MSPTELALPTLGYGAANVGNLFRALTDDEAWAVLEAAWDAGIRYFDTAPHYGLGLSERRLGAFLQTKPRGDFVLSTKVGRLLRPNPDHAPGGLDTANDFHVPDDRRRVWDFSEAGIRASIAESQERLGIERIDLLYLHDPERHDLELAIASAFPALEAVRAEGIVGAVGVGSMVSDALARSVREADLDLIMVAGRYTLLEQSALDELFPAAEAAGARIVAAAPYNSGLLSTSRPQRGATYDYAQAPDELIARGERLAEVCESHGVDLPTVALQFPLRHALVEAVVFGTSRAESVRSNVRRLDEIVPEALWDDLVSQGLLRSGHSGGRGADTPAGA